MVYIVRLEVDTQEDYNEVEKVLEENELVKDVDIIDFYEEEDLLM